MTRHEKKLQTADVRGQGTDGYRVLLSIYTTTHTSLLLFRKNRQTGVRTRPPESKRANPCCIRAHPR